MLTDAEKFKIHLVHVWKAKVHNFNNWTELNLITELTVTKILACKAREQAGAEQCRLNQKVVEKEFMKKNWIFFPGF